jgi:hypothetical protein
VIYLIYLKDREEDDRISDVGQRSADPNNIFADAPLSLFYREKDLYTTVSRGKD